MKQLYTILFFFALFLFFNVNLNAQQKIKESDLSNVKGTAIGNDNESID